MYSHQKLAIASHTHMLLPVRQNLPKTREQLNPGPLSKRCGDMTKLDQRIQKSPGLRHNTNNWQQLRQYGVLCVSGFRISVPQLYYSGEWLNFIQL